MSKPESFDRVMDTRETATPTEIDEILAWSYGVEAGLASKLDRARTETLRLLKMVESVKEGNLVKGVQNNVLSGIRLMESLNSAQSAQAAEEKALREHLALVAPFEAEYSRRGGWSRYFLVMNENGHIHRSMHCSTCNREGVATRFGWLTEFSGTPEQELTEQVGPNACTVCYPWAETIRIDYIAGERARRAADKAAAQAEKARIANEKGITTPEGGEVHTSIHFRDIAKTLRTAEIALTDAIYDLVREGEHKADPEYAWMYEGGRVAEKEERDIALLVWHLVRSIAAKKGLTFTEVYEAASKKADAKVRKADRDWAKDPRNPNRAK